MAAVRPPAVAGLFYPADPAELTDQIDQLLAGARPALADEVPVPKAVIVPHAGYIYSGFTAAHAYALVARAAERIRRVVLLGPCHRVPVRGLALSGVGDWATPLGVVELDEQAAEGLPGVVIRPDVHAAEHSLEVQVPFLQRVLGNFTLTPLAVGSATPAEVAGVLDALWGGDETLIVISSDLSHYHRYADAQRLDRASVEQILARQGDLDHDQACGATPVNGFLTAAQHHELTPHLLSLTNSGDTAGDKNRVVGYASVAWAGGAA